MLLNWQHNGNDTHVTPCFVRVTFAAENKM